jgi:AcrR family transcriptional regulator
MSARIIGTAAQLFATQGFAATSMEQVAAACNAGKDTIYRRFPSKVALFGAVLEHTRARILDRLESEIAATDTAGDPMTRLKRVARWFLTINLDPELLAFRRIALSEGTVFGPDRPEQAEDDPLVTRLVAVVASAQEAGTLRGGDPEFLAWHLLHCIVFGPSNEAMLGRTTYDSTAAQDAFFERAWELFLNGAAAHERRRAAPR